MLPHQDVQPGYKSQHVCIIIYLGQTVLGISLEFIPDIPFVKSDLEWFGGKTEIDPVDLS